MGVGFVVVQIPVAGPSHRYGGKRWRLSGIFGKAFLKTGLARLRLRPKTTRPKTQDEEFDLTKIPSRFQGI
jgi:hypothetical protein